jgi:hypothetical protein
VQLNAWEASRVQSGSDTFARLLRAKAAQLIEIATGDDEIDGPTLVEMASELLTTARDLDVMSESMAPTFKLAE